MTRPFTVSELKARLMRPALTSHYICSFAPPGGGTGPVNKWLQQRSNAGLSGEDYYGYQQLIELSCCDASLPGSSLTTNEINDDYHGVSEKHAYRRLYDDRSDFTFYVNNDYRIISFFEGWISYIVGEEFEKGRLKRPNYSYRVRFPETYKTQSLSITKFERDTGRNDTGRVLVYSFVNAFPISIASMPVNYDQSQLLKCTVSFSYERYVIDMNPGYIAPLEPTQRTATGLPDTRVIEGVDRGGGVYEYSLRPYPGQFTRPLGTGGAVDLLGGLGGIGIRNVPLE